VTGELQGLTADQVAERVREGKVNTLPERSGRTTWQIVRDNVFTRVNAMLAVLFVIVAATMQFAQGAFAILIVANSIIGMVQELRAKRTLDNLAVIGEAHPVVLRDGQRVSLPRDQVVADDLIALSPGDQVVVDGEVVAADYLEVDESMLTGEADPVAKSVGDELMSGAFVVSGSGVYRATKVGAEAYAAQLTAQAAKFTLVNSELRAGIDRILKFVTWLLIPAGLLTIWVQFRQPGTTWQESALRMVGALVPMIPEGLVLLTSMAFALGVIRLGRRKCLVQELPAIEGLARVSVVCADKTGTLTRSEMTIQEIVTASGTTVVTGIGYAPDGEVAPDADRDGRPDPEPLTGALRDEVTVVLSGGAMASDAELAVDEGVWSVVGDPTEGSFLVAERKLGTEGGREGRFERVGEVPFTSERKLMSVLYTDAKHGATILVSKGAPDVLMGRCTRVREGDAAAGAELGGVPAPLREDVRERFAGHIRDMSGRALRTLGVAYRVLSEDEARLVAAALTEGADAELAELERDLVLAGVVGIIDPPRPEAAVAVAEAHRAGIRVLMITGDHPDTAGRIAADLGIAERGARVLTGRELSAMDDGALAGAVTRTNVYARVAPEHKMRIVGALKSQGHTVSMTGDGVNDAPALRAADIGVAMGVTGTQVTKEAAAMVLADDNFATIVDAVREGRRIFDNIKKFLRFLLSSNMGEVLTVFGGVVLAGIIGLSGRSETGVVLPLLATQILWINLVTDSAPALAMGVDPSVEDVMGRPPRKPTDRVIDATMWGGVLLIGAVMAVSTLAVLDVFLPGGLIDIAGLSTDDLPTARTAAFSTLVLAQLFNTLNSRSETVSALHHLFVNKWLWGAIGLGAVLQVAVVEVPVLQVAFSTEPLDPIHWAVVVAMASLVLWVDEIRKAVRRARGL